MIELISIIGSLAVCILTPVEVARIRGGWTRKKFGNDREKFLTAYRAQLNMLTVLGIVFGVLGILLAAIESDAGEQIVKLIAAAIWFAVACICFISRRMLPNGPATGSLTSSSA